VPKLGRETERLETIPGQVPNPARFPTGCKFHTRCPRTRALAAQSQPQDVVTIHTGEEQAKVMRVCQQNEPVLREVMPRHWAACHFADNFAASPQTVPQLEHHRAVVPELIDVATGVAPGQSVMQEAAK
jgi:oligopeptide/dipeptide ABC transporter ATP-binding protein